MKRFKRVLALSLFFYVGIMHTVVSDKKEPCCAYKIKNTLKYTVKVEFYFDYTYPLDIGVLESIIPGETREWGWAVEYCKLKVGDDCWEPAVESIVKIRVSWQDEAGNAFEKTTEPSPRYQGNWEWQIEPDGSVIPMPGWIKSHMVF
jgi:hypothetical protein